MTDAHAGHKHGADGKELTHKGHHHGAGEEKPCVADHLAKVMITDVFESASHRFLQDEVGRKKETAEDLAQHETAAAARRAVGPLAVCVECELCHVFAQEILKAKVEKAKQGSSGHEHA
jgi:hypothetical protein